LDVPMNNILNLLSCVAQVVNLAYCESVFSCNANHIQISIYCVPSLAAIN
jgi:hypothetical protein